MRLICVGDVGLCETPSEATAWARPLHNEMASEQSRVLFNWELPCGERIVSNPRVSGPRIVASTSSPSLLSGWSPAVAALANNHLLDAGIDGITMTTRALQSVGISSFGGGLSTGDVRQPWIWKTEQGSVGVLNWVTPETHPDEADASGAGPNLWPGRHEAAVQIANLKAQVDWVVIYIHWSDELFSYPRPLDREIARKLTQFGADVIIGHHPHVVRGMEEINGTPVFYSLGNYFFGDVRSPDGDWLIKQAARNREALVVELVFRQGSKIAWRLHSYWQDRTCTRPDSRQRAARRAAMASHPLNLRDYDAWYERKRRNFDVWGYRWHFRLPKIGWSGTALWLLRRVLRQFRFS